MASTTATTAYRAARDQLLSLSGRHDDAMREFRWPDVGDRFNWAIDWFDAIARGNGATALAHHKWVKEAKFAEWLDNKAIRWDVHGVFVPERPFDIAEEASRLRGLMDSADGVNLFVSEGAGVAEIVASMEQAGEDVPRDPFGHVRLDDINPGAWFAKQFAQQLGADKVLVQKSGYFARSAAPNAADLELIRRCTTYAVDAALRGESGVVGQDEERGDELRAIEFERIKGGKAFDPSVEWFTTLLADLGQS